MEVDIIREPTKIVDRKPAPRTLSILPPCFDESNRVEQEYEILDGLPYIEHFTDMQIANAEKAVADEMRNMEKPNYLKNDPMPKCRIIVSFNYFFSLEMAQGYKSFIETKKDSKEFEEQIERIYRKEGVLDFERYECLGPRKDQIESLSVWKREIDACKATYAHQLNGLMNLELMKKYNSAQWSEYNKHLRQRHEENVKLEKELQQKMDDTNRQRKIAQLEARPQLDKLENEWWSLVRKNNEIELQSQILKSQIDGIRQIKQMYAKCDDEDEDDDDVDM